MQLDIEQAISQEQINKWMRQALVQSLKACKQDQIPVGCIFVKKVQSTYEKVISSHNLTNLYQNASRHCQINCILQMQKTLNKQQISKFILFVTVQPCIMCTFALNLMGIKLVYFGQFNDKFGGCGTLKKYNQFKAIGGIMQKQSLQILKGFYQKGNQRLPQEMRHRGRKKIKNQ